MSVALLRRMLRSAEAAGVERAEYVRRVGLTREELEGPGGRVPWAKYERALLLALELPAALPPPWSEGLAWIEEDHPVLAAAWLNAPTLRAALHAYAVYRPILDEAASLDVREEGEAVVIEYRAAGPARTEAYQAVGCFNVLMPLVRAYDRPGTTTRFDVDLRAGELPAPDRSGLEARAGGRVRLGAERSALRFPRAGLDLPLATHNPALQPTFLERLRGELEALQREAALSVRVERSLRAVLPPGGPGATVEEALQRVRADLRLTEWTLRRQLAREGVTFRALFLRHKLEEARRLLQGTTLSMREIAGRLGFDQQSSFTRFFRRAAGVPPQQYRRERFSDGARAPRRPSRSS